MKNSRKWAALVTAFFVGACSSSDNPVTIDQGLADRIDAMNDCFPGLQEKLDAALDIAQLWNQQGNTPPDPPGLTYNINGAQIDVTLVLPGTSCTFTMTIKGYQQSGVQATPNYGPKSRLSLNIRTGATDLRDQFPNTKPFFVGDWTASGTTAAPASLALTGSGAFTGIIRGVTNGNELEELRTTTATPAGGTPPLADGVISLGAGTASACTLRFNTASLKTDTVPNQQFPIGTLTLVVTSPKATVNATMVFNNTNTAQLTVDNVPGRFDVNLTTFAITYVPPA